jgi:hypothetical protein
MARDLTAVIMALRTVLAEAEERSSTYSWNVHIVNRWIRQLPGAWTRKWRHLKLRADYDGEVSRDNFVTHVRATLAYLEAYQCNLRSNPAKSTLHKIWLRNLLKVEPGRGDTRPVAADNMAATPIRKVLH